MSYGGKRRVSPTTPAFGGRFSFQGRALTSRHAVGSAPRQLRHAPVAEQHEADDAGVNVRHTPIKSAGEREGALSFVEKAR